MTCLPAYIHSCLWNIQMYISMYRYIHIWRKLIKFYSRIYETRRRCCLWRGQLPDKTGYSWLPAVSPLGICVSMHVCVCAHFHKINSFSCYSRYRSHKSVIHSRNAARNFCYVSSCRCFKYHWTCDPGLTINLPLKIKQQVTEWH